MAMRLTNAAASAAAGTTGLNGYISTGPKLKIFTGDVNANAESAPAGTLLGTITLADFGSPTNGAIASEGGNVAAADTGTAGCWALYKSDGSTKVADGSVAETTGGDINFDETAFIAGGTISVGTFTITVPPA